MKDKGYYYQENIECACHGKRHVLFIDLYKYEPGDPPMMSIEMFTNDYDNVFKRIWQAIKYILRIGEHRLTSTVEHLVDANDENKMDELMAMFIKYKEEVKKWRDGRVKAKIDA